MDRRYHYDEYSQDSLRNTSFEDNRQEKLIITIDIGDGRRDEIIVREFDNPRTLAEAFCQKHHLNQMACKALIDQIEQNVEAQTEEQNNSLISINKSYDSKVKKSNFASGVSSSGFLNDFTTFSIKQTTPSIEERSPISSVARARKSNASPLNNVGQKLYMKGLKFIENVQKKKLELKVQQTEKELKESTFSPIINSKSTKRPEVENILINKGKVIQENIEKKRGMKLAEQLSECTFSPMISKKTEKTSNDKPSPDRFVKLYENAKSIQNKIQSMNFQQQKIECPFKPDIRLTRANNSKMTEKREKISQSRKAIEEYLSSKTSNKDPSTGQDLFKPMIGRPPKTVKHNQREPQGQKIGEYLYSKRSKSSEPKRPSSNTSKLSLQQSEKILTRIKELRFKQIFEDLKPNEHERITPESVKKASLSPRTLKILTPLLQEMESLNEKLNFSEFCESMECFFKSLRPDERSILLKTAKPKVLDDVLDFKPKINENSFYRPKSVENLYERNLKKQQWVREKCELQKKEKEDSELIECTFKPKILRYSNEVDESEDMTAFSAFKPLSESYYY